MPHGYPGFDDWKVDDPNHRFPVDDINVVVDKDDHAQAEVEFALPQAQPNARTVALRYAGIQNSAQLWVALECTRDAQNTVTCEAVLRGKHLHWFRLHAENGPGLLQEIRLTKADMLAGNRREVLAPHGSHCDLFSVSWGMRPNNKVHCVLAVLHVAKSVQGYIEERARANREAEREPPRWIELRPWPTEEQPLPEIPPEPKPNPGPGGAMAPGRPGGVFGAIAAVVKRVWRAVFG